MPYKMIFAISLISINAFALLNFPEGTFVLDGKVLVDNNDAYLAVNYKSNSEIRIKLTGSIPKELMSQGGSNASIRVKIAKPFFSTKGEAQFVELKRYLDPFEAPAIYNDENELPKN
jgi:hypothetical protein